MKVTLLRAPFYSLLGSFKPVNHLGLAYISSVLKKNGHSVKLIDAETMVYPGINDHPSRIQSIMTRLRPSEYLNKGYNNLLEIMETPDHPVWKSIVAEVEATRPQLIGITCFSQNLPSIKIISRLLKKAMPDTPIIVGGIHPSSEPVPTLEFLNDVDYLAVGEGEETMLDLCKLLEENRKDEIPGLPGTTSRKNGAVIVGTPRALLENLDELPFPDRSYETDGKYYNANTIFTSRGCPFSCTFCASKVLWTKKVRYRSIDNVIEEIRLLVQEQGSSRIRIDDDTFTVSKKRVLEFCDKMEKNKLHKKVSLSLGSRVDTIDYEMLKRLKEVGADTISFGVESGSPRILEKISKNITPEKVEETIKAASGLGIRCLCYFMIGHPGETVEDVKMSMDLFQKISNKNVDVELNIVSPYPQTPFWEAGIAKGLKLPYDEYHKLFHQGDFLINISEMTSRELTDNYKEFLGMVSRQALKSKVFTLGRLLLTGRIKTVLNLIRN